MPDLTHISIQRSAGERYQITVSKAASARVSFETNTERRAHLIAHNVMMILREREPLAPFVIETMV
jgi:hypothetical protein